MPYFFSVFWRRNEPSRLTMTSSEEDMSTKSEHQESLSQLEGEVDAPDQLQVKRIKKKIDLRICLVLGVMYTASLVDRVNLPVSASYSSSFQKNADS